MEDVKELRQMPEIQNIAAYLRGMTFRKKTFGGYDIESVYEHFSAVTQMYEAILCACMEQVDRYARELAELQVRQEERVPAAPMPMQQPYMAQNPWLPAYPPSPWAQQSAPPQAYYAAPQPQLPPQPQLQPQQAYAWQNEPDGLPEPAFLYA